MGKDSEEDGDEGKEKGGEGWWRREEAGEGKILRD